MNSPSIPRDADSGPPPAPGPDIALDIAPDPEHRPERPPQGDPPPRFQTTQPVARSARIALAAGTVIGGFEILRVIGSGGFSIVYLARDPVLDRHVAIKEYLPSAMATRGADAGVVLRDGAEAALFEQGLDTFMNEARLLARFDHPSLLRVHRFWREHGTAYMAMPYLQGVTLLEARQALGGPPDEAWLRGVLVPLLDALDTLHAASCFHRDLSPDNVVLLPGGTPVLLDFGAARSVRGDGTQQFTAVLKPAYAPIEQYAESTQLRQGPWTDLYAWGAVARFCITGKPPAPATVRAVEDLLRPLAAEVRTLARGVPGLRYGEALLDAIDWSLALRPLDRPQNVAELRRRLGEPAPAAPREAAAAVPERRPRRDVRPDAAAAAPRGAWRTVFGASRDPGHEAARQAAPDHATPPLPPMRRDRAPNRWPLGLALAVAGLCAAVGWRVLDDRATARDMALMATSMTALPGAGGSLAPSAVPPARVAVSGGAVVQAAATPTQRDPGDASIGAPPQSVAANDALLAPGADPVAVRAVPAIRKAAVAPIQPDEEIIEELAVEPPARSTGEPRGTPALLSTTEAPPRLQRVETRPRRVDNRSPAAVAARRTEPSLNDAVPSRKVASTRRTTAAAARPLDPRGACARQERANDYFCLKTQCKLSRYYGHRECVALRKGGWWGFIRGG